jgi:nonsense-mediated mRNA decay protein 3
MKLGKRLQNTFGGVFKKSTKLFTRDKQTSKNLYRLTVLFRLPRFKKGDIIKYKGEEIRIINLGKKVFAKNIKTGKKYNINYKDL